MFLLAERRTPAAGQEEANVRRTFADDDGIRVDETAAVDDDREVAGRESGQRAVNAARKLVARGARADRFAYGKREQVAHAHRRREGKGR